MRTITSSVAGAVALLTAELLSPSPASAGNTAGTESRWGIGYWNAGVRAPYESVELTLSSSYVQGVGRLDSGPDGDLSTRVGGGIGIEPGFGYRLSPWWMVGASGAYELYSAGSDPRDSRIFGAVVRAEVTMFLAPFSRVAPWVRLGSGYRLFYDSVSFDQSGGAAWHGFELVRAMGGVDIRTGERFAVAPLFGMDLSLFLWRREPIADPRLTMFAYLGLQGRFDIGGHDTGEFGVAHR
jgi:hypothetical protein